MRFKIIFFIIIVLLAAPLISLAQEKQSYERGRVLSIGSEFQRESSDSAEAYREIQKIRFKMLSGENKGEEVEVENILSNNPMDIKLQEGDDVLLFIEELEGGEKNIQVQDHWRLSPLLWLVVLFFAILLIIGRGQGAKAIIGLLLSGWLIFKVFIPRATAGGEVVWLAFFIALGITVATFIIVAGFNRKSLAAIIGSVGGLLAAILLSFWFSDLSNLSGLASEEARMLFSKFPALNMRGILFAGIIIGALGAVMDVAMSIASSVFEVSGANTRLSLGKLFESGMNVGRDIMGTMTNTLIFAYVGASLALLILFYQVGESYLKFLNFDFVAEEMVRSLAGSIGLVLTIPLTSLVAAILFYRKADKREK